MDRYLREHVNALAALHQARVKRAPFPRSAAVALRDGGVIPDDAYPPGWLARCDELAERVAVAS